MLQGRAQEEVGLLHPAACSEPCVVVCELLPGWTWALEGLPFQVEMVVFGNMSGIRWLPASCKGKEAPLWIAWPWWQALPSSCGNFGINMNSEEEN